MSGAVPCSLGLPVDLAAERAQDVEHQADDDEIDAGVEEQRRREMHLMEDRQCEVEDGGLQDRAAEQHGNQGCRGGHGHAETEQRTRAYPDRQRQLGIVHRPDSG